MVWEHIQKMGKFKPGRNMSVIDSGHEMERVQSSVIECDLRPYAITFFGSPSLVVL